MPTNSTRTKFTVITHTHTRFPLIYYYTLPAGKKLQAIPAVLAYREECVCASVWESVFLYCH